MKIESNMATQDERRSIRWGSIGTAVAAAGVLFGALLKAKKSLGKRVAVFGLSGDPPTGDAGHKGIVRELASAFDEVWVLPVYQHPYESKSGLSPFEERVEMCRRAFSNCGTNVHVLTIERDAFEECSPGEAPSTYATVRLLKRRFPFAKLHLVVGSDAYADLKSGKWRYSDKLQSSLSFVVVPRHGAKMPELGPNAETVQCNAREVSSSAVRQALSMEQIPPQEDIDPIVAQYALERQLYTNSAYEQGKVR